MKRFVFSLLSLLFFSLATFGQGEAVCTVKFYDETDGLSQRLVKQIVQDRDGLIWIATWNGLNRFDGYSFSKIKPGDNDEARSYSDRIIDIKLSSENALWCKVDDSVLLFDLESYRFDDISSRLEDKFGKELPISQIQTAEGGKTILKCFDGNFITLSDSDPVGSAVISDRQPDLKIHSVGNRKLGDVGSYRHADLIYSRRHSDGSLWIITRAGEVLHAPSEGANFKVVTKVEPSDAALYYSMTDRDGNIWLRSSSGAYCLTPGTLPYSYIQLNDNHSLLRTAVSDGRGNIWMSDNETLAIFAEKDLADSGNKARPVYIGSDGKLSTDHTSFGQAVYSIAFAPSGDIWLGCKPGILFRLHPKDDGSRGYIVERIHSVLKDSSDGGIYDLAFDKSDRLWIADLGDGIICCENPDASSPHFIHLADYPSYPRGAMRVRHLTFAGDSLLLAATTGGLLSASVPPRNKLESFSPTLHVSKPGESTSLGNIAVMDVLATPDGSIFVSTESDGINMSKLAPGQPDSVLSFTRFNSRAGIPSDIALSVAADPVTGNIIVTGNNMVYNLDPLTGKAVTYKSSFWRKGLRFSDARPLKIGNDQWLLGTDNGPVVANLVPGIGNIGEEIPVFFTSVSIQNRPDSVLSFKTEYITLKPDERNITLSFASLSYIDPEEIRYSFRIDGGEWTDIGKTRSVSLLDLKPGTHRLEIRSTDSFGRQLDNAHGLTVNVTPKFRETKTAAALVCIAIILLVAIVIRTVSYVRDIKRKQRETLEAYLNLLDSYPLYLPSSTLSQVADSSTDETVQKVSVPTSSEMRPTSSPIQNSTPALSVADEKFMEKVMYFVNTNLGDPSVTVDDMAASVAISRSGLNRKMKGLLGLTPADFLRESRLSRAASMLAATDLPVKDIATDCGFSDLNYFSKCFKSQHGITPTAYRKEHSKI